jgi:cytochrome P450
MTVGTQVDAAEAVSRQLFLTTEGRTDPYPLYRRLRELGPVHRTDMGLWLLSRYDDCWAALRDPRLGKDYVTQIGQRFGAEWRRHPALTSGEHSMLNTTGPEHTRLRKLVSRSFTPRMIQGLRPVIERTVAELLDPIAEAGGGDILADVGFPLPVTIIGEMLGVPTEDRPQFRMLVHDIVAIFEMQPTPEQLAAADAAQVAVRTYFLDLIAHKRRRAGEDLLSALVHTESDGDRLSDDEIATMASLLFAAGFETTTNLFGNGLWALLRHPDQLAKLRTDDSLYANLPDEFLRYDGTAQVANRMTEAAVDVGGVTIPAGEQVFALLGAGNRDPSRFDRPDELDVTRTGIQPLTFGGGVHFCLGAALARAEIEITFRSLLGRFDVIEPSGETPRFQDRLALRGLESLDVRCRAAGGAAVDAIPRPAAGEVPVAAPVAARARDEAVSGAGLRPEGREADLRWRAELRQRIETEPTRADSVRVQTGERLAATVKLLASHRLFARCTRAELERLAATAYPMSFEPGDMLCVEGAESEECYVIEVGHAVVSIGRKGVGTVGEGDVVGERGILLETVRSATVTATSHVITYAISRERLQALVGANPEAKEWMLDEMRRRYPDAQ